MNKSSLAWSSGLHFHESGCLPVLKQFNKASLCVFEQLDLIHVASVDTCHCYLARRILHSLPLNLYVWAFLWCVRELKVSEAGGLCGAAGTGVAGGEAVQPWTNMLTR